MLIVNVYGPNGIVSPPIQRSNPPKKRERKGERKEKGKKLLIT